MIIKLSNTQKKKILIYLKLIKKWNYIYNLTNILKLKKMVYYYILESLNITYFFNKNDRILDLGSGCGIPSIIIAIYIQNKYPKIKINLVDSQYKKIYFLKKIKLLLKLNNINIYYSRIENLLINKKFNIILSKGLNFIKIIFFTYKFLKIKGYFLFTKNILNIKDFKKISKKFIIFKIKKIFFSHFYNKKNLIFIKKILF